VRAHAPLATRACKQTRTADTLRMMNVAAIVNTPSLNASTRFGLHERFLRTRA
jgi:hypothetical protein